MGFAMLVLAMTATCEEPKVKALDTNTAQADF